VDLRVPSALNNRARQAGLELSVRALLSELADTGETVLIHVWLRRLARGLEAQHREGQVA
jgi:hypothetical protein